MARYSEVVEVAAADIDVFAVVHIAAALADVCVDACEASSFAVVASLDLHMFFGAWTVSEHGPEAVSVADVVTEVAFELSQPVNFSNFVAPNTCEIYLCYSLVSLSII